MRVCMYLCMDVPSLFLLNNLARFFVFSWYAVRMFVDDLKFFFFQADFTRAAPLSGERRLLLASCFISAVS